MTLTYLLVGNPTSRSGQGQEKINFALEQMTLRKWDVSFLSTLPQGRTVPALSRAIEEIKPDVVVAMGGDGTFGEVAKGILRQVDKKPLMGLIPAGTANDQARSFGIPLTMEELDRTLTIIESSHLIELDVGHIAALNQLGEIAHEELFFDSAGWGMQADILATRNVDRKAVEHIPLLREIYRDEAVFVGAVLNEYVRSWVEPTKFNAIIKADGQTHRFEGLTDLILNNSAVYAAAWVLDPESEADDGLFELAPMIGRRDMFSKLIRDLHQFPLWQKHLDALGLQHSEGFRAGRFEFQFERATALRSQVDGEEWVSGRHFRATVLPNQLPLIIPQDFKAPWKT